jgi:hypothetical protein
MIRKEKKRKDLVGVKKSAAATSEVESKSKDDRQGEPLIDDEETSAGGDVK